MGRRFAPWGEATFPLGRALRARPDDDVCLLALGLPAFFADIEQILSFDTAGHARSSARVKRRRCESSRTKRWMGTNNSGAETAALLR